MDRMALVLGATGKIGGAMARTLLQRGWRVRALSRGAGRPGDGIEWLRGDAMIPADVRLAAAGATLIVHGVNPPRYRHWDRLVMPMLEASIAAARATGARLLLPGTIYNYGPDAPAVLDETTEQRPSSRKGAIRVAMEQRLRRAAADDGLRVLVVRAGDYFGAPGGNSWFSDSLLRGGAALRAITYPGAPGVGHAWAYVPDLAEAMMRLVERDEPRHGFAAYHFGGHYDPDGGAMIAAIRRALGRPDLPIRRFPWRLAALASPLVPFLREVREIRYLWRLPFRLDNANLTAVLEGEPHTPLDRAVQDACAELGFDVPPGTSGHAAPTGAAGNAE